VDAAAGTLREGRKSEVAIPKIREETLAEMGRHNPVAGQFLHEQVQEAGLIRYNGELEVSVVLHD
jgi:hypothetical protein